MHSTSSFSQRVRNTHVVHMARYSIPYTKWKWSNRKKRDGQREKRSSNNSKKHTKALWKSGYCVFFLFTSFRFGLVWFLFTSLHTVYIRKLELVNAFAHRVSFRHSYTRFSVFFSHIRISQPLNIYIQASYFHFVSLVLCAFFRSKFSLFPSFIFHLLAQF